MSAPLAHLHPAVRDMLALEDGKRIQDLQRDRWIDYPRAGEAINRLERLLNTPQKDRMPCMVLHGPSNISARP